MSCASNSQEHNKRSCAGAEICKHPMPLKKFLKDEERVFSKQLDQENENNGQPSGLKKFEDLHRAMNPRSSDRAARINLADQMESKSRKCAGCWGWKKNNGAKTEKKSQCCRLCRQKRKTLTEEERNVLRATDLKSMFVPLQKSFTSAPGTSSDTNPPKNDVNRLGMKDGIEDYAKGHGRKNENLGNSSGKTNSSHGKGTERSHENHIGESGHNHEKQDEKFEITYNSHVREPKESHENSAEESGETSNIHNEGHVKKSAPQDCVNEFVISDPSKKDGEETSPGNHNVQWKNRPSTSESRNHEESTVADASRNESSNNFTDPADYTEVCCYLCTQKAAGHAAGYIGNREKCCDTSVQTVMRLDLVTRELPLKFDKSCNHVLHVRTVRASVNITSCNKSTETDFQGNKFTRTQKTGEPAQNSGKCGVSTRDAGKLEPEPAKKCATERRKKLCMEKNIREKHRS